MIAYSALPICCSTYISVPVCAQVYVLSVPTAGQPGHGRTPDSEHYFIKDLVVRLQAGQVNADGSPLNRCCICLQHIDGLQQCSASHLSTGMQLCVRQDVHFH